MIYKGKEYMKVNISWEVVYATKEELARYLDKYKDTCYFIIKK